MKKNLLTVLTILVAALPIMSYAQNHSKEMKDSKKILVAFFSRTGENYAVGNIEKGNTHFIADMIAEETGGTLFHIEPVTSYPENYTECTEVAKKERENRARPAIKGDIAVEDYDVVFIGYPNWWGDMPMAVYTFIEKHNWNGKTVVPFCTHEGSGLSGTERKLKDACKGATISEGLAIKGTTAQNSQPQALKIVQTWLLKMSFDKSVIR